MSKRHVLFSIFALGLAGIVAWKVAATLFLPQPQVSVPSETPFPAETGVETDEQLALLKAEGCEERQGYLFSKPLAAEELEPLLRESSHRLAKASQRI